MSQPEPADEINDPKLRQLLHRFQKTAEQRAREDSERHASEPELLPPTKLGKLPFWPEPVRGAPNVILRSALFAGIHSKKRQILGTRTKPEKALEPITIAAQTGIHIKFAGLQLNQYDGDVFFEALHRARHHPLGTECFFTGYDFLHSIGRSVSSLNYEDLHDSLTRLRDARVEIEWHQDGKAYHFEGGLIAYYTRQANKLYKITFAEEIKILFAPACWTQLEWAERLALSGHPQAQWMHGYFCTHAKPFPVSVAYLHQKSASPTTLLKHYRTELKRALATLEKVLGWQTSWENDLITVTRPPSASQAHHLITRAAAERRKWRARQG
jgi:hypothetical protein